MKRQELTLGYSPCPNDTYIFCGIADGRIDTAPLTLRPQLADVEILNRKAQAGELDITKLSFHALLGCLDEYWLLRSGGALGRGCGPIVVAREEMTMEDLRESSIAVPGERTTAHLLLQLQGAHRGSTVEIPFDWVMPAVARGDVDAGLVIHEGRFTYSEHGLTKIVDLGAYWEEKTGLPIPLGCIVIRRSLGRDIARLVEAKIRESLALSRRDPDSTRPYIKKRAQEMEEQVIEQHVTTFVNDFSVDVGAEGERAIRVFLKAAAELRGVAVSDKALFWDE